MNKRTLTTIFTVLTGAGLAVALSGCVDVAVDVDLTSPATATATLTQVMAADFYAMRGMSEDPEQANPADAFCPEGELTENADGSATCTLTESGSFADLDLGQEDGGITFTPVADDQVRVAVSTAAMAEEVGAGEAIDAETEALIDAFFQGRTITLTFSGAEIVDTNMTLSEDKTSASQSIPLVDLIKGEVELPDDLYAVVRAP